MSEHLTTVETAVKLGLLPEEFEKIREILGRTPNFTELAAYSGMWSEHCSYKNSIKWLKTLPRDGSRMLVKAGEENAGLVDIGDGLACAFKIESHNHPSAIEPYQGAATGVGGINRDIFTMGARPVAQLNSLRFGLPSEERTRWLMKGVVKGIGNYGNSFGIPTVGGEVFFDEAFHQNPLVNAMSVGIMEGETIMSAVAKGAGNPVYIVGSATGKDGIHGASFASEDITEESAKNLPSVQVGDPFQEKLLLEATLEVIASGAVVGIQDMGAAGILCSTSEMSAKGEHGMEISLDRVPTRQEGMLPFELLLSESQERMLIVVKKGMESTIERIFEKWDLSCARIGEVVEGGRLRFYFHGELVADIPAESLVLGGGAPVYEREYTEPAYFAETKKFDPASVALPADYREVAQFLVSHPNIASKRWVFRQYDSMVGTVNMSTNLPSDAAVVNLKGTDRALALSVDCNSRYVHADPETGAMIAVCEAARNIACSGGIAVAVTNCLNFGNPYNPEAYWQFVHAVKGMGTACRKLDTPVTGGNVSFYNQSKFGDKTVPVFPTPTIGMLGVIDRKEWRTGLGFRSEGDVILLAGKVTDDIGSSEYLYSWHEVRLSPAPYFDLDAEFRLHEALRAAIMTGKVSSAHDVSDGGLICALLESAFMNDAGFRVSADSHIRRDAWWFGEGQGRAVVSVSPAHAEEVMSVFRQHDVPVTVIGTVSGKDVLVDGENWGSVASFYQAYENTLPALLEN